MYNTNRDGISRLKTNAKIPSKIYMIEGEDFTSSPKISNFYEIELYESIQEAISSGLITIPSSGSGISSDANNELTLGSDNLPYYNLDFTEGSVIFADNNGDLNEDNSNFYWNSLGGLQVGPRNGNSFYRAGGFEVTNAQNWYSSGSRKAAEISVIASDSTSGLPNIANDNVTFASLEAVAYTAGSNIVSKMTAYPYEYTGNFSSKLAGSAGFQFRGKPELRNFSDKAAFYIDVTSRSSLIFIDNSNPDHTGLEIDFDNDNIILPWYDNTRDDSGGTTPINFIYSDNTGLLKSAPSGELTVSNPISVTATSIDIALSDLKDKTFDELVIVKESSDFGTIDSTKVYFIDGIIDMGTTSVEIPSGGINITGHDFNTSKLTSSDPNFTLFTSPAGGSGDVFIKNMSFEITGSNSQLFDLTADNGFEAVEMRSVNFNNCTSLGELTDYRQGLELNTGRFGGTPSLTLSGTWSGGYFIETSIARSLTDGAYALYQEGTSFTMASRFKSNQNLDLNSTVAFMDFTPSNFLNPSILQLQNCIVSRNGTVDASDTTIIPNIDQTDIASYWRNNVGLSNTFVGGETRITTESVTTIAATSTFVDVAGTFTTNNLEHFDSPAAGQLRHLGDSPREFDIDVNFLVDGGPNDEIDLKIVVWDDSASSFVDYKTQRRAITNSIAGADVAYFYIKDKIYLDRNDYVKVQVANTTDTSNVTIKIDSEILISQK